MSGKTVNYNGVPLYTPNDVVESKGFYISYNDRDKRIYGDVTTALVDNDMTKFLILNGNHVNEYNKIIANNGKYEDCIKYFLENSNLINEKFSDKV